MAFAVGQSEARQPRGVIKLNDTPIAGWVHFSVDSNRFSAADTFTARFVIAGLPAARNAAWFSAQKDLYVECFAGFPDDPNSYDASGLKSQIYGQADEIHFDPENGVIEVTGRDLTRVFIDSKTTQKWPNLTASQIVTQLAKSHSLTPVVTATTDKAGIYYEIDYVNMTDERTEWDLICYLAQTIGFQAYVKGKSLYFEPQTSADTAPKWPITWIAGDNGGPPACNVSHPVFTRNLNVSRGIQVVVRSWNAKQKKGFNASYPSSKASKLLPGGSQSKTQVYHKTIPGLTQDAATKRAEQIYKQLIQHEMLLEFESAADNDLSIRSVIPVTGTGTSYDQSYYPDSINRSMDIDGGYAMTVHAKNHSPDSASLDAS